MAIEIEQVAFTSHGCQKPVHAVVWLDAENAQPKGIIQLVHGMCEYVERYDSFARFLVDQGFIVCGEDHLGHGKTAGAGDLGVILDKGGANALVENVQKLRHLMETRFGEDLPYFIFGHSMGSFIVRSYLLRHASGLAGAIICGTGYQPFVVAQSGLLFARGVVKSKGGTYVSKTLHAMADGAYSKAIPNARTPFDWICTDPAVVDAYIADPLCGFPFTAGAYVALTELLVDIAPEKKLSKLPKDLPIFFIAGADDPVGDRGRGVLKVYSSFRKAGMQDVDLRIYLGMRHEVLNEPDKDVVYADVSAWLEGRLS